MTVCSLPLLLLERAVDFPQGRGDQAPLFQAVYQLAAVSGAQLLLRCHRSTQSTVCCARGVPPRWKKRSAFELRLQMLQLQL